MYQQVLERIGGLLLIAFGVALRGLVPLALALGVLADGPQSTLPSGWE